METASLRSRSPPRSARLWRWLGVLLLVLASSSAAALAPVIAPDEAPRVRALLEQAWAMESGDLGVRHPLLAVTLYCMAGRMGSAEAYYRAGRALQALPRSRPLQLRAAQFYAQASQLGHAAAARALDYLPPPDAPFEDCSDDRNLALLAAFDLDGYVARLPVDRRQHARLVQRLAHLYGIPPRLALAVALVESNFHADALSPKDAMGVMQLIPATAARFAVKRPYDPEQNIRGGLAYLRWLKQRFNGDVVRMVAAYNAGEGAVERYGGIPPYEETRDYVLRVLRYSSFDPALLPAAAAGPAP